MKHHKGLDKFYNWNYKKAFFKTSTAQNDDLKTYCLSLIEQKLSEIATDVLGKLNRDNVDKFFNVLDAMEGSFEQPDTNGSEKFWI